MVPPTPLASLSSLADRFATIINHRQGPYLTPGNQILGVFCSVVFGFLYLQATEFLYKFLGVFGEIHFWIFLFGRF